MSISRMNIQFKILTKLTYPVHSPDIFRSSDFYNSKMAGKDQLLDPKMDGKEQLFGVIISEFEQQLDKGQYNLDWKPS